ncbi:putative (S)-N-methylcoclaurine 3'-hydroxylase isozyme 2 [Cucumis melo var. makuwa]|uniref:(S)-N-methylcoclaurine 3'-hydroxylase isozyme 2 n=1 Tax=Cucumis melo var. makuwa TaxID=1194695 RepID=A0A5A7UIU3_CUCMM|nr:putative (S)-N-methylcoclaurine 3'-hydroxylase isozyme 2 [Cucumis melo var. makuwa]
MLIPSFSILLPSLLLLLPIFIILKHIKSPSSKLPLPPGPNPWPILGNLLQIGQNAHISITQFANIYGPLISLKLGAQRLIVASSPAAATAVLKTQDRLLSARYIFQMTPDRALHDQHSLVFSPECGDQWKNLRSLCKVNLFTAKAIESQAILREKKMKELVKFLESKQGSVVEVKDFVFTSVFNTLSNLIFSMDLIDFVGDGFKGIKGPFKKMMDLGLTPNLADFYPLLRRFDLQGLKNKADIYKNEVDSLWGILIKERREIHCQQGSASNDFLDVLIQSGFDDQQINALIIELLSAGTDTTTTTVEWAMSEILKDKDILNKVREEMKKVTKENRPIDESNISELQYLWRCVKETLRLHPPAPFLLPRLAPMDCEVMGYSIPKDSMVFVNVWGIGRDPSVWEDSQTFNPQRFDVGCGNDNVDFKGYDYRYLPFGGGRRICPGLPMAIVQVPLILATLIHNFEWSLPNDEDLSKLDLNGRLGVTLQKYETLKLIPKRRVI